MRDILAVGVGLIVALVSSPVWAESDVFEKARNLERDGKTPEAISALKSAADSQVSDDKKGLIQLYAGLLAYRNEKYAEAQGLLTQALKKSTRIDDYIHYFLGMSNLRLGDRAGAKKELEIVKGTTGSAFLFESRFGLAQIAIEERNWSVASAHLEYLERKARSHIRYPDVLWNLMLVDKRLNHKWKVCRWAQKMYAKYPAYPQVQSWGIDLHNNKLEGETIGCTASLKDQQSRIRRLQWNGMSDRARKEIDTLETRTVPTTQYLVDRMLAQYLLNEGYVEESLRVYLKHYETEKSSYAYLIAFGNAAARAGEMQAAIGAYYRAYNMSPKSKNGRQALFQAAFLSYRFQDYDGAGRKFEELVEHFPRTGLSRDAKWHLAWIRYLKGDYRGAYASFNQLISKRKSRSGNSERDFSNEKMRYWMAMSLLKMGDAEKARMIFDELAADKLYGYYAIAAKYRLSKMNRKVSTKLATGSATPLDASDGKDAEASEDGESEENLTLASAAAEDEEGAEAEPSQSGLSDESVQVTSFDDPRLARRFDRARDLRTLGLDDWVKWELFEIERRTRNPNYMRMLISEYETSEVFNRSSYIGQTFFSNQRAKQGMEAARPLWEATYPKAYSRFVMEYARSYAVPEELVWGIMRAESQYRADVTSPVGALGLMQLMPFTARQVASLLGVSDFQTRLLIQPETNVKLGTRYLRRLLDKFNRQVPLVAAGYNAGPHRVEEWLYSFGHLEMDEFIEHIPFVETRNYVKKVVRNFQVYKELYGKERNSLAYLSAPIGLKITAPPSFRESWDTL